MYSKLDLSPIGPLKLLIRVTGNLHSAEFNPQSSAFVTHCSSEHFSLLVSKMSYSFNFSPRAIFFFLCCLPLFFMTSEYWSGLRLSPCTSSCFFNLYFLDEINHSHAEDSQFFIFNWISHLYSKHKYFQSPRWYLHFHA